MNYNVRHALTMVRALVKDLPRRYVPPSLGASPRSEMILPMSIVRQTRGYIEIVAKQVNGTYENGWYDACAVMMRRLLEMLIIESFEHHNIAQKIKNGGGDFLYLNNLISKMLQEPKWNLGRTTKRALPKLKDLGNQSAHSRRFNATREDIDKVAADFRTVAQELVYLAGLK
jgi:hypothetical protein